MIHHRTLHSLEFDKVVAWLADLCVSSAGRALAQATAPLADSAAATEAFILHEEHMLWSEAVTSVKFAMTAFPDIGGLVDSSGITPKIAPDLDAFWALRQMLREARKAVDSISDPTLCPQWPHLYDLAQNCAMPAQLLAALNRCISDDGYLKDESSPELYRLRNEIRRLHQGCLRKVKDYAQQYNMLPWLQDEFMTLSSDRYVLPLKANFKGRMQGIIHDWSQTGETCYFEPMFLVEVNNRLQELKHEERAEERKILDYLGTLLEAEAAGVRDANSLLADLDLLNAKKLMSGYLDCSCVTFTQGEQGIELLSARHPLLALARQNLGEGPGERRAPAKPLDIILRPGDRVLVITGGNAGGKTVCLKTMGLLAAMAMSGLPVPAAKGSHLPWFERMDAFIGDEQSLDDNVSTFTAQIDHLARAWKYLDNSGLALLDEFGAGTDPAEGAALAQAVLDGLLEKNCFVLAATHFPALKTYALTRAGVRAASMLFDPATGRPMFKIAYDQVGSSQALAVAAEHGMPEEVLARARHYLLQDGQNPDALLARLNSLAAEREKEVAALQAEKSKVLNSLAEKKEKLDKEKARLNEDVRGKIAELMRAWKSERASARQTLKEMSGLRRELGIDSINKDEQSVLPQARDFSIGQTVLHTGFNRRGIIRDIDERKKRARLDMNGVSLWAAMADLRDCSATQAKSAPAGASVTSAAPGALSIDLRGMRADEALAETQRFLDRALLAGFGEVEIIHGRGTGVLRRQIHDFLRTCTAVANFATAPADRGGDGMTIVTLK